MIYQVMFIKTTSEQKSPTIILPFVLYESTTDIYFLIYRTVVSPHIVFQFVLNKFQIQAGVTLQQSHYSEPHTWNKDAPAVKKMMRTPNTYGYFTATYTPIKPLSIALSGTYTGSMLVPHEPVPGFLENPITVNTKDFFDIGLKAAYDFKLYKSMNLQINAGIQNIFNAYQDDFDKGADRDSGYIYGPSLPRSFFAGVKISY